MLERFTPYPEEGSCAIGTQSFCVALTRDHHGRHPHQCPEVVSLTRRATSCLVPLEEELVLCIPQSPNLCDIECPDTSCTQVFANRLSSGALEHFPTLAGLTQGNPTDSHATHHDDAALRLDAKQSPHLSQKSNRETKLSGIVVVCRHHRRGHCTGHTSPVLAQHTVMHQSCQLLLTLCKISTITFETEVSSALTVLAFSASLSASCSPDSNA